MMNKKCVWRTLAAIPIALACTSIVVPVAAQEPGADVDDAIEEITVTGSKLRRDAFSSISPV